MQYVRGKILFYFIDRLTRDFYEDEQLCMTAGCIPVWIKLEDLAMVIFNEKV